MTFAEYCAENGLTVLTPSQVETVCKSVQRHGYANARGIAFDDSFTATLAIAGGNLDYYAGLEYDRDSIDIATPKWTAYRFRQSEDCRLTELLRGCVEAAKPDPLADLDAETLRHALREAVAHLGARLLRDADPADGSPALCIATEDGTHTLASL